MIDETETLPSWELHFSEIVSGSTMCQAVFYDT